MLLSLCITNISAPVATLIISPWKNNDRNCWGKSLTSIHRIGLIHLIIKILCWGHPFMSIQIGQKYFHVLCVLGEVYPHISSDLLATNFLVVFLLSPWPPSQTIGHSPWIDVDSYLWPSGYFSFQARLTSRHTAQSSVCGRISFQHYPTTLPRLFLF